jgi:hypothetical protein
VGREGVEPPKPKRLVYSELTSPLVTPTHTNGMAPTRLMRSIELSRSKGCHEGTKKCAGVEGVEPSPELFWRQFGRRDLTPMGDTYPLVLQGVCALPGGGLITETGLFVIAQTAYGLIDQAFAGTRHRTRRG